ncbi:FxsA family protein [Granulosicoccaceae sp. 1_MG-2023]|nr:FxsA family protein [Granulosicoccaceae sp. 1_MG-2023]
MFPAIFFLFVAIPIIEIALLIKVGGILGLLPTLGIVILTAVLGTAMLRAQSVATVSAVRSKLDAGEMPALQMFEGAALLVGGVLLLTPGFVTDAMGFFCLLPLTRRWLIRRILARSNLVVMSSTQYEAGSVRPGNGPAAPDSNIIDGEFRRED